MRYRSANGARKKYTPGAGIPSPCLGEPHDWPEIAGFPHFLQSQTPLALGEIGFAVLASVHPCWVTDRDASVNQSLIRNMPTGR